MPCNTGKLAMSEKGKTRTKWVPVLEPRDHRNFYEFGVEWHIQHINKFSDRKCLLQVTNDATNAGRSRSSSTPLLPQQSEIASGLLPDATDTTITTITDKSQKVSNKKIPNNYPPNIPTKPRPLTHASASASAGSSTDLPKASGLLPDAS